jgi:hypothetical protein
VPAHFWDSEALYLTIVALFLTWALLRITPAERGVYLNTLWLFLLGIAGQAVAALLSTFDVPQIAATARPCNGAASSISWSIQACRRRASSPW